MLRVLSLAARSAAGNFWVFECTDARERDMRDCAEGLGLGLGVLRFRTIVTHAYYPTYWLFVENKIRGLAAQSTPRFLNADSSAWVHYIDDVELYVIEKTACC